MRTFLAVFVGLGLVLGCGRAEIGEKDPDKLIRLAWDEFRLSETIRAESYFAKASALAKPGSETQLMALYGWGASLSFRSPTALEREGAEKWEEVIRIAPQSDMAAWCLLALARQEHVVPVSREPDMAKVLAAYDRLTKIFPDHPATEEAFLFRASTKVAPLKPEGAREALEALQGFLKKRPGSPWQSAAWALMAECYAVLDEPVKRLDAEVKALEKSELDPNNPRSDFAGAYWKIATLAEFQAGDFPAARKYYKKLFVEYPTDQKRFASEMALARMDRTEAALRRGEKP